MTTERILWAASGLFLVACQAVQATTIAYWRFDSALLDDNSGACIGRIDLHESPSPTAELIGADQSISEISVCVFDCLTDGSLMGEEIVIGCDHSRSALDNLETLTACYSLAVRVDSDLRIHRRTTIGGGLITSAIEAVFAHSSLAETGLSVDLSDILAGLASDDSPLVHQVAGVSGTAVKSGHVGQMSVTSAMASRLVEVNRIPVGAISLASR